MHGEFVARASILIHAPASTVWTALTKPEIIKKYFFGADIVTDWKVGSPILYRGEWQGKPYEDKGTILKFVPGKLLVTTHWSPLSGAPDAPENYHTVTYELSREDGATRVALTQDNNASEDEKSHSEANWTALLQGLQKVVEATP